MPRIEGQPKRITSGRLIAAGVVLGVAASGSAFVGHSETHSADTGANNTLRISNTDINSIHSQNPDYLSVDKQMEALSNKHKQSTVKVEITKKGETLTEATAKAFEESTDKAFARLQKDGLAQNDLVYVGDTFEVPIDRSGETGGETTRGVLLTSVQADSKVQSAEAVPADCIPTDVKGRFEFEGNHRAGMKVVGHFENVSTNPACPDKFWVDVYGSDEPVAEGLNWLETQHFNQQIEFQVKAGEKKDIEVDINNVDDCFYQTDAVRTKEKLLPPRYNGVNMIDYTITKDVDSCLPTATATKTATSTVTFTSTPANTEVVVRSTNTPLPTNTPVTPTNTPANTATAINTPKSVETPPPANVVLPISGTGFQSTDLIAPWIKFAAGASSLGLIGLGLVQRGLETLVTVVESEEDKKKKKKSKEKSK